MRVFGTSNRPLETVSRRPGETSTMPLPTVIFAVRPFNRSVMSASRIDGSPATGRIVVGAADDIDRQAFLGHRRADRLHLGNRGVGRDVEAFDSFR